jgi:hypothetical protein
MPTKDKIRVDIPVDRALVEAVEADGSHKLRWAVEQELGKTAYRTAAKLVRDAQS